MMSMIVSENNFCLYLAKGRFKLDFFKYFYNFKAIHTILTKYKSKWVAKKSLKFASLDNYFCKIFTNILKLQTFSNFSHLVLKDFQVWSRAFFQKDKLLFSQNMTAFRVASKALKTKENFADNGGHNILRIFDILPNLSSTAIKAGFDLLIKKWYIEFASRAAERLSR